MADTLLKDNLQLALDEMRLQMERVYQASDALDQKANFLLAGAGIVVGVATVLQPRLIALSPLKITLLGVSVVMYVVMVALVLRAMAPAGYVFPLKADYKVLEQYVLTEPLEQAISNVILGYTTRIDQNKAVNAGKARAIRISMLLLSAIFTLLAIASAL